jgi:type I restriction enzyme M protein
MAKGNGHSSNQLLIETLPDGKIRDYIDEKLRNDTPEEYVRQNIERRLVKELSYPRDRIEIEFTIQIGSGKKRVDIALFPPGAIHNQDNIETIIECKHEGIPPKDKSNGVEQLKSYLSACPNANWGLWTNSKHRVVLRKLVAGRKLVWQEPNDIPGADGRTDILDRPTHDDLIRATDDNLLFSFRTCHDHIYVTDGLQKQPAFFELLKVIFCKIYDERQFPAPLEFFASANEKASHDGRLTVKQRINKIFTSVRRKYPSIFDVNDEIKLQPRSLAYIVGELQRYSFLDTHIDVKGKAYEELVGANLRGDRGEFFTPRNVQRMAIRMLDIKENERVLDPSCGTGGFLVIALSEMIRRLELKAGGRVSRSSLREALTQRIQSLASQNYFGFDINPDLVKATKMNMVMNNDGSGNVYRQDMLLHPHEWERDFKRELSKALGINPDSLRNPSSDLGQFDVIATNPPFGAKLPIVDRETLSQYELAHVWQPDSNGAYLKTDTLQGSQPPEILFIERCFQLLRPGGRMAIVLPDGVLGNPQLGYVRWWIIKNFRVVASIDLHPDTFQPRNGTQTSVLILQKKTQEELGREARSKFHDYSIFMAQIEAIGHDKRGNTVYVRNEDGEEILFPPDDEEAQMLTLRGRNVERRATPRAKRFDDDTPKVATAFLEWKESAVLGW